MPISFSGVYLVVSELVLQACVSFLSVSDKSGAFLFLPYSQKNAVSHVEKIIMGYLSESLRLSFRLEEPIHVTVGFLYGAGAETLFFRDKHPRKKLSASRHTKVSGVYP